MNESLPHKLWAFIGHFLKPYKRITVIYVCIALCTGCWGPFNSILIKNIIDSLYSHDGYNDVSFLIWPAVLLVLNFIICDNITWRSMGYLKCRYKPLITNQIIQKTFRYVLRSSHQFFQDNLSGRISSQISILTENIECILFEISQHFIRGVMLLIISFISMFYVHPTFSLVLVVWLFTFAAFSISMSKRLVDLSNAHAASETVISGQLVDSITNTSNIRLFAKAVYEVLRLEKFLLIKKEKYQTQQIFSTGLALIQGMLIAAMLGAMLYFLIQLRGRHLISIGDFALILGLTMEVGFITWWSMQQIDELNKAVGKCKQSLERLLVPLEIEDKQNALDLIVVSGQIKFDNVKFHYKGAYPLFQNKFVTIEAGQKVGLVGYSGSGKSTFVNLILRLYDVTDGKIMIDDQDIKEITQDSLRENIGMIPQEPSLFHRSLKDNIRYGRVDATDEEVIEAAKRAHAHEFICKLPQGYDTLVGERGVKLSGGQRQRIAIARAILKNAPILILDEATSQLDSITEIDIQESLWDLMQEKTTIIIAHRLSTLMQMDRILVFDQGKIIQDGAHLELIEKDGLYKKLWDAQVGGFLIDQKIE